MAFISKGFLKLLTIKINGKTRRFDRASVIIKCMNSKNIMIDIYIDMHVRSIKNLKNF